MKLHWFEEKTLVEETAKRLNELFKEQEEFLFLISGGSSLALLEHLNTDYFGPKSTISILDERHSDDPGVNNFAQIEATAFYKKVIRQGASSIDTKPEQNESIDVLALRFEKELRKWERNTKGVIIATVGIGPDAHTSGILPHPEEKDLFATLFDTPLRWVTSYDAGDKNKHPLRVTTILPFLRRIDHPIIFISGESKREALLTLLSDTGNIHEHPGRIWREIPGTELYTDIKI